jgi:hypothetical protein
LVEANEHPLWSALDIGAVEADHFTDAQASRVGRHQESAVLGVAGGGQEPCNVADTEHLGEALGSGPGWEVQLQGYAVEGFNIEEADRGSGHVAGPPGQLAFFQQVVQRGANLLGRALSG